MPGTIFRLPDDLTLQRGITYTFLPDGRRLRVPSMNRMQVRADAQGHQENEDGDIMQALQDIIKGKKPGAGRAKFNRHGVAQRMQGRRAGGGRPVVRYDPAEGGRGQGLRPVAIRSEA